MLGPRNAMKVFGMMIALCCAGQASAGSHSSGPLHGLRSAMTQQQQQQQRRAPGMMSNMNQRARRRGHMEVSPANEAR